MEISILKKNNDELVSAKKLSHMYAQWIDNKNRGLSIVHYLRDKRYTNVAIYGFGECGRLIYNEIKDGVDGCYAIDRNAYAIYEDDIEVLLIEDAIKKPTDIVIVSIIPSYELIKKECVRVLSCPVVSIEEIVNDLEVFI